MKYFWTAFILLVLLIIGFFVFRNKDSREEITLPLPEPQAVEQKTADSQSVPQKDNGGSLTQPLPFQSAKQARIVVPGKAEVIAEVVEKEKFRRQGLSGRPGLPWDKGMLFIFETRAPHAFWMRGMLFSLDIIWIDGDRIVDIKENLPAPSRDIPDDQLPIFKPQAAADKVLEVNAGWAKAKGLTIGDRVEVSIISKDE